MAIDSIHVMSYGTPTEQWHVNRNNRGYWLTHIRRDSRINTKVKLRAEDYEFMRDIMDSAIKRALKENSERSDVYVRTPMDAIYMHRKP